MFKLGMQTATQKYKEWIEWVENGRGKNNKSAALKYLKGKEIFMFRKFRQ